MMKKLVLITITLFALKYSHAQVTATEGSNSVDYPATNKPTTILSFADDKANYMVLRKTIRSFEKLNTLIIIDKSGTITTSKDLVFNRGSFNDNHEINNIVVSNGKIAAFIESRSKDAGKNSLAISMIDNGGTLSSTSIPVGDMDITKMSNPGSWYIALTPDKKHTAIIGQLPHEKNMPEQFKYFFLDENFKEISKGQFSFAGYTKSIPVWSFTASDKGDLYIISEEFDKSYKYPVVYSCKTGATVGNIIPVIIADPALRVLNYVISVNAAGALIIAGYSQQKKTFSMGDVPAAGSWTFNSSKPQEVKTFAFDKPVTNLTARNIIYNGDTFFMIGEQYKEEKEPSNATGLDRLRMEENFIYEHDDIMINAFNNDGTKKFDLPISRKWSARNIDQEFMIASGVINDKLAIVYNDQYGKYIDDKYHRNLKLPVAVLVNNNGLMDAPVHFEKELDVKLSSYTLIPAFYSSYENKLVILSINSSTAKAIIFK